MSAFRRFLKRLFGIATYPSKPVRLQVFMQLSRTGEMRVLVDLPMTAAAALGALHGTPGRFMSDDVHTQEARFKVAVWFE